MFPFLSLLFIPVSSSVCLSLSLSLSLSLYRSIYHSIYRSIYLSIYPPLCLSLSPYFYPSPHNTHTHTHTHTFNTPCRLHHAQNPRRESLNEPTNRARHPPQHTLRNPRSNHTQLPYWNCTHGSVISHRRHQQIGYITTIITNITIPGTPKIITHPPIMRQTPLRRALMLTLLLTSPRTLQKFIARIRLRRALVRCVRLVDTPVGSNRYVF